MKNKHYRILILVYTSMFNTVSFCIVAEKLRSLKFGDFPLLIQCIFDTYNCTADLLESMKPNKTFQYNHLFAFFWSKS